MRTLFDVDWPEAKNIGLFLAGFLLGFFAPSMIVQIKNIVMSTGKEVINQRGESLISIGKENTAGAVAFLLAGILSIMALMLVSFFLMGIVVGLTLRYILWYHMRWIPEPDVMSYFNIVKSWVGF